MELTPSTASMVTVYQLALGPLFMVIALSVLL